MKLAEHLIYPYIFSEDGIRIKTRTYPLPVNAWLPRSAYLLLLSNCSWDHQQLAQIKEVFRLQPKLGNILSTTGLRFRVWAWLKKTHSPPPPPPPSLCPVSAAETWDPLLSNSMVNQTCYTMIWLKEAFLFNWDTVMSWICTESFPNHHSSNSPEQLLMFKEHQKLVSVSKIPMGFKCSLWGPLDRLIMILAVP